MSGQDIRIEPKSRWAASCARALLTALALAASGCHRAQEGAPPSQPLAAADGLPGSSSEAGYLAPPSVAEVRPLPGGGLLVVGRATAGAKVQVASPEGDAYRAQADRQGRWAVRLPAQDRPRLYALSATLAQRSVHAEGALITTPQFTTPQFGTPPFTAPKAHAVMVRAGYAALPLAQAQDHGQAGRLDIAAVDYDPGGFVAVAGAADPHAPLRLWIDGSPAAVGQAGADGRYALLATTRRLLMGAHRLELRSPGGAAQRDVLLQAPSPLTTPYQAAAIADGWTVEWALTGGGVQTTLIFDR